MKLTIKFISIIFLVLLATPIMLLKGCGEAINGGQCGGCPDSTAPYGSKISATSNLGAPSTTGGGCYPAVSFLVTGPDGQPLNNICVELFTDGVIAKHTGQPDCTDVWSDPKSSMIVRTNSSGAVIVAFAVPASTAGTTFFVQAVSCSVSALTLTPVSAAPAD